MRRMIGVVVLSWMAQVTVVPQAHPDFSGRWEIDAVKSVALRADERQGTILVMRQTPTRLVIERTVLGSTRIITYALDGSEAVSQAGGVAIAARSRWDAGALVTEGTQSAAGLEVQFIELRRLSEDGQTMIIESTFTQGNDQLTRKAVFTRSEGPRQ